MCSRLLCKAHYNKNQSYCSQRFPRRSVSSRAQAGSIGLLSSPGGVGISRKPVHTWNYTSSCCGHAPSGVCAAFGKSRGQHPHRAEPEHAGKGSCRVGDKSVGECQTDSSLMFNPCLPRRKPVILWEDTLAYPEVVKPTISSDVSSNWLCTSFLLTSKNY